MIAQVLWHSLGLAPLAALGLAVIVGAVAWLYPPQIRALVGGWRWMLLALRVLAIGIIIASILQPAVLRPKTIEEKGAVVVLIDRSRSMSVADKGRTPAESVALADALGLLPGQTRSQVAAVARTRLGELHALTDDLDRAASESDYAALSGRGREIAQQRLQQVTQHLAATSAAAAQEAPKFASAKELSQALAALGAFPAKLDSVQLAELRQRIDRADHLVSAFQSSADAALYVANAQVRSTCDALTQQTRAQLIDKALREPERGLLAQLPRGTPVLEFMFAGNVTRPQTASTQPDADVFASRTDITGALRSLQDILIGRPLQGIVLFSDGRQTRVNNALPIGRGGAPIFAVSAASNTPSVDLAISRVTAPYSIFAGESATVRVELRGSRIANAKVDVSLDSEGNTQTQPVVLAEDSTASIEFPVKFEHSGVQKIVARAAAIAGEVTEDNNTVEQLVKVLTDKVPVTMISGAASWDAEYLRGMLGHTRWIAFRDAALTSESPPPEPTAAQLLEQGVVVLLDVGPTQLDAARWDALHHLVSDRAASVIIATGTRHGARALQAAAGAGLLPFAAPQALDWQRWSARYFQIDPAPDLSASDADQWPTLMPISRFLKLPKLSEGARPLLVERDTEAPILIESHAGRGRLFFLGTDESWRWRQYGENENRFWQQLIRYACDEPYAAHRRSTWLDVDNLTAEPGQNVRVRAKIVQSEPIAATRPTVQLQVMRDGKTVREVSLKTSGSTGQYEGILSDLRPGEYQLRLGSSDEDAVELPLRIAETNQTELANLTADERLLRRVAESSGGAFLRLDEVNALPQKLAAARDAQNPYIEYPLWDSPYLFLFVIGALGTEWAMRKQLGLA